MFVGITRFFAICKTKPRIQRLLILRVPVSTIAMPVRLDHNAVVGDLQNRRHLCITSLTIHGH